MRGEKKDAELFIRCMSGTCYYQRNLFQCNNVGGGIKGMGAGEVILGITLVVNILKIIVQYKGKQGK